MSFIHYELKVRVQKYIYSSPVDIPASKDVETSEIARQCGSGALKVSQVCSLYPFTPLLNSLIDGSYHQQSLPFVSRVKSSKFPPLHFFARRIHSSATMTTAFAVFLPC
jgi:hypothetical protein